MSINLDGLPNELNSKILSFLDLQSLGKCCQVSTRYNALASSNIVWNEVFRTITFPTDLGAKKYIESRRVTTTNEIFQRFQDYVNSHTSILDKSYSFTVLFPFNPKWKIIIRYGRGDHKRIPKNDTEPETAMYIKKLEGEADSPPPHGWASGNKYFNIWDVDYPRSIDRNELVKNIEGLLDKQELSVKVL